VLLEEGFQPVRGELACATVCGQPFSQSFRERIELCLERRCRLMRTKKSKTTQKKRTKASDEAEPRETQPGQSLVIPELGL
jgi:hypothetical protein